MSFESTSLEITGWDQLWSYVQQFNGNNHHQIKICLIDEEGEEIRIESEEEFQSNVQVEHHRCSLFQSIDEISLLVREKSRNDVIEISHLFEQSVQIRRNFPFGSIE